MAVSFTIFEKSNLACCSWGLACSPCSNLCALCVWRSFKEDFPKCYATKRKLLGSLLFLSVTAFKSFPLIGMKVLTFTGICGGWAELLSRTVEATAMATAVLVVFSVHCSVSSAELWGGMQGWSVVAFLREGREEWSLGLASKDNPGNTQRKTFTTVEGRPHSGKHKIKRKRLSYVNQIPKASSSKP